MTPRFRGWLVLAGIVGIAQTAPRAVTDGGGKLASAPAILNLRLTVSSELPGIARKALITETESIWRDGHVKLRWLAGSAGAESGPSLRILVTPRAVASAAEGHRWTVGELLRFEGSAAIAVASITGARAHRRRRARRSGSTICRRCASTGSASCSAGRSRTDRPLCYSTRNTHAPYGLMRAAIDAREFADLRAGSFRLDRQAQAHLAARATGVGVVESDFSYASQ